MKGVLKQELSGIQVTTFFGIISPEGIEAMKLIYFSKCKKILCTFQKTAKNFHIIILVLEIMAFEPVARTCLNYDENTCDRQSTCYQTILRFQI